MRRLAQLLEVEQPDAPSDELRQEIQRRDEDASQVLDRFFAAWSQWYEFHRQIDENGRTGRLTSEQHQQLETLIGERDDARAALIRKTKQLELRRVTIRIPPHTDEPGKELEIAASIRRDLYAHGPIEIDPDAPEFSTLRDSDGWAYFVFTTAHQSAVKHLLDRFGYSDKIELIVAAADTGETCLNCGQPYEPMMPTVCLNCGFRDISPCPQCGEDIPRLAYIKIAGNLHRCPACVARVRMRFNDPLTEPNGHYAEPQVIVEDAVE